MYKKITVSILITVFLLGLTSTVLAFGGGACRRCSCSGFHPKKYGFSNMCNCGHWETEHTR